MYRIKLWLRNTKLWVVWKKIRKVPPFKQIRKGYRYIRNHSHRYFTLKREFPRLYNKYAQEPVDERKVIFVELRLPDLTNSFQILYHSLKQSPDYDVHVHFLRNTFVPGREYDRNCREFIRDLATAKYVFMNEANNLLCGMTLRPETIVTQTWHACGAFKRFGFSTADMKFGASRKDQLKYPFNTNYTHVTVSSPEVAWAYEEAMNLKNHPEIIKPVGTSRTDIFYQPEFISRAYERLHYLMPSSIGKKVILYAPTFRGRVARAAAPDQLDIPLLKAALGREYVLLIKHHPLVRALPEIPAGCESFAMDVTNACVIDDLLCVSDICISDYSSLVFEYSLFERPMLFFAYDRADYDDWRGFYYNYDEMTPGPVCTTNEEIIDYILHLDTRFDRKQIRDFRKKFMSACDGHATERIFNMLGIDADVVYPF